VIDLSFVVWRRAATHS